MSIFIIHWKLYAMQPFRLTLKSFSYQSKNARGSAEFLSILPGRHRDRRPPHNAASQNPAAAASQVRQDIRPQGLSGRPAVCSQPVPTCPPTETCFINNLILQHGAEVALQLFVRKIKQTIQNNTKGNVFRVLTRHATFAPPCTWGQCREKGGEAPPWRNSCTCVQTERHRPLTTTWLSIHRQLDKV